MKALCDGNLERYIRKRDFAYLNALPPIYRFAEKFRLELESLSLTIRAEDEIVGWFVFDGEEKETVLFDDERIGEEDRFLMERTRQFGSVTNVDKGHTLIDYEYVLKNGLIRYSERVKEQRELFPEDEYLKGMEHTLETVAAFTERMAGLVDETLEGCGEEERKRRIRLRDMIKRVPLYPARDFTEAIQAIWVIHFLLPLAENAWYSISLGRLDRYLYPYYLQSREEGMGKEQFVKVLHNLYSLLNSYADGACLLNVGGDGYNELSELLVECQKSFAMPAPILGARVTDDTPEHIWELLIDEKLFSMGQPTFYGEYSCLRALREKGLTKEEAACFSNNSCMGISLPGREFCSMWGCVFVVPAALEAALNNGRILDEACDITVPDIGTPTNTREVFSNFEKCCAYLLDICVKSYEKKARISESTDPDCFVSLLTGECIEKHCDRISGADYHSVTVECMGMVNASDGIRALDRLVFGEKKYTLEEISEAVKHNFTGYDQLRADLMACDKYGENSEADRFAVLTAEILQRLIRSHDHDNIYYAPSLHTLDANVEYAERWGAGYDGRYAGAPFAKNAGPSNEVRKQDPTSMLLSSSGLPQYKFFGGQPVDVNFQTDMVRNHKKEIAALIRVYLQNGGLQFQVNSLSSDLLRRAAKEPEKYPGLVVRIGGYSVYFNSISRKSKEEFIERFEREGF